MKPKIYSPPFILALESATEIASVALFSAGELMGHMEYHVPRTHAKLLLPMIQTLLKDLGVSLDQLDALAVSKGPGSYTGLRVGVSTMKGLALAQNLPLLSFDSLTAIAYQVEDLARQLEAWICPMIDARRMEVYMALFNSEMEVQEEIQAKIIEKDSFAELLAKQRVLFVGNAVEKCLSILKAFPQAIYLPTTISSSRALGTFLHRKFERIEFEDLVTFEPFYLKDFVATKPKKLLG
ncbi:MAG: tRNA (adenosine(37)-N6)-threonylcarbamoyltransferase complex dimerization subunit type 1 TsaB [Bacteroidota bacterium]